MAPAPQALFFDLDDTILAFSDSADSSWAETCQAFAEHLHGRAPADLAKHIHAVRTHFWSDPERHRQGRADLFKARQTVAAGALARMAITDEALAKDLAAEYIRRRNAAISLFPGAIDTLRHFKRQGLPLALLTNGSRTEQRGKIARFDLEPYFDCIVVEGEFGVGKPDPAVFHHALDHLQVAPEATWMIGDNLSWEIAPAQALGLYAVWVDWAGTGLPADSPVRPDRTVRRIAELVA